MATNHTGWKAKTGLLPTADTSKAVRTARVAGAWYLLLTITALPAYLYIPGLIVPGDATATAANIASSGTLLRLAILSTLISAVADIPLAWLLYGLLKGVGKTSALLMVSFGIVSVPITFVNMPNLITALGLVHGSDLASVFSSTQLDALATVSLGQYIQGTVVDSIFFGLWLLPFGFLVYRSGFIPRILGAWLVVNGCAYVATSVTSLLGLPQAASVALAAVPLEIGELAVIAWLLLKGVRVSSSPTVARPGAHDALASE